MAVIENFDALKGLRLDGPSITKIAGNDGGARAITAVIENFDALQGLGLDGPSITKIAGNNGGARAIKAVIENFDALKGLGLDGSSITKIAGNGGGAKSIEAVVGPARVALIQQGVSLRDIVDIARAYLKKDRARINMLAV